MKWVWFFITLITYSFANASEISIGKQLSLDFKEFSVKKYQYTILFFQDPDLEIDKKVYNDLNTICLSQKKIGCVLFDVKHKSGLDSKDNFYTIFIEENIFNLSLPYIIVIDSDKKVIFFLDKLKFHNEYLKLIISFYSNEIDKEKFDSMINELTFKSEMSYISPKLNFLVMLHKKGEKQKSLEIINDISKNIKTDKAKILVAQISLRIEHPKGAIDILNGAQGDDATFYRGISYYLLKDYKKSIEYLLTLYDNPNYKEKVREYLIKSYEELGEYEKAKKFY